MTIIVTPKAKTMFTGLASKIIKRSQLPYDARWKHWVKEITGLDQTKNNGFMYEGSIWGDKTFEVENRPHLILVSSETGSAKYRETHYEVFIFEPEQRDPDGFILSPTNNTTKGNPAGWALRLRDGVKAELDTLAMLTTNKPIRFEAKTEWRFVKLETPDEGELLVFAQIHLDENGNHVATWSTAGYYDQEEDTVYSTDPAESYTPALELMEHPKMWAELPVFSSDPVMI